MLDLKNLGGLPHPSFDLVFRRLTKPEPERHILVDVHMRVQSIVLKDHGDVAILGRHIVHHPVSYRTRSLGDLFETGNHPERGGLATT